MSYPILPGPGLSPNNFVDHFSGSSLNARWGSFTSGTGTVTVTDSYVDLNAPASSASCLYYATQLDKSRSQLWTACLAFPTSGAVSGVAPRFMNIMNGASTPAAATNSTINGRTILRIDCGTNASSGLVINGFYFSNAGTQTTWDSAIPGWAAGFSATAYPVDPVRDGDYYRVGFEIDGPNARWRAMAWNKAYVSGYTYDQGERMFWLSDWVTWANTRDSSNLWVTFGVPFNDDTTAHECRVEWVRYAEAVNNYYIDAWFDQSSTRGSLATKQQTRHHWSFDGQVFVPQDRTTVALALGSAGSYDDADISPTWANWDGVATDYLFYQAASTGASSATINVASATHTNPQNGTWTKSGSNPLITLGANESIIGFPAVIMDKTESNANKRWKMLFSVKSSIDSKWRMHLATSPDPPTTWTRQGVILDVGAAGQFDETAARDAVITFDAGQWRVWYEAWDASGYASLGLAVGPTLTIGGIAKDGVGARLTYQTTADTALTANLTGRTVTVTSTSGFAVDGRVIFCQSNNGHDYSIGRIRKILSSTQVELYTGLDGFTTTVPARMLAADAIRHFSLKQAFLVNTNTAKEWWFYLNTWGPFLSWDGANYAAYRDQVVGLYRHGATCSFDATAVIDQINFPIATPGDNGNDSETLENTSFLLSPFQGNSGATFFRRERIRPAPFKPGLAR